MPRKGAVPKRDVLPDPVYNSKTVTRFINKIMLSGKKSVAQGIVYAAFETMGTKTGKDPLELFETALKNVMPVLEVRARRVGGANYQVPVEVRRRIGVHAETPSGLRSATLVFRHQAKEPDVFPDGADQCRVLTPPVSGGEPLGTGDGVCEVRTHCFLERGVLDHHHRFVRLRVQLTNGRRSTRASAYAGIVAAISRRMSSDSGWVTSAWHASCNGVASRTHSGGVAASSQLPGAQSGLRLRRRANERTRRARSSILRYSKRYCCS